MYSHEIYANQLNILLLMIIDHYIYICINYLYLIFKLVHTILNNIPKKKI